MYLLPESLLELLALQDIMYQLTVVSDSRDSSVSIATPGIKYQWGRDFLHPSRPAVGPTNHLYNGYQVSFSGINRPGHDFNHPPPFQAEVKEFSFTFTPPLDLHDLL
jgi:hypothetical protein